MSQENPQIATVEEATGDVQKTWSLNELRQVIVTELNNVLTNPDNLNTLANQIFTASTNAIRENAQLRARTAVRPVLTRVPYPGCLKATVLEPREGEEILDVSFEEQVTDQDKEGWKTAALTDQQHLTLRKLVLSQTTVPGDVYYVTTSAAIDAALEAATDEVMAATQAQAEAQREAQTAEGQEAAKAE